MHDTIRLAYRAIALCITLGAHAAAAPALPSDSAFARVLSDVRQHFCPDRRVAVFDIAWSVDADGMTLRGEVDNSRARDSVLAVARAHAPGIVRDSIAVLPHASLGDSTYGIVTVSVGNVRSRPGHPEELATQVTMGLVIKVLKRGPGHYYVQSHDGYLGWLEPDAFHRTDARGVDRWASASKVIVTEYFDVVRSSPDGASLPVCDAVVGNILRAGAVSGAWREVTLADGRTGFIRRESIADYTAWSGSRMLTGPNIERSATMFLGVPYLWGGTSSKGMDCSGFTKTVFRLNGMELNRDASQQVLQGRDVDPGRAFENLRKGDLLFFGRPAADDRAERIVHVAIYLENREFIHSSGRVRFGSFDPSSPHYDDYNLRRFVRARRVIPEPSVPEK